MRDPLNLIGEQFGPVTVREYLGHGVASQVYAATDEDLRYALKVFRPGFGPSNGTKNLSAHRKLYALVHPNLCRLFKLDRLSLKGEIRWYALLELIKGQTLRSMLEREGPLTFQHFRQASVQLVDGLLTLQSAGLRHGDIKPANVLVEDFTKRVVLTDFDFIAEIDDVGPRSEFVGSIYYAAPERLVVSNTREDAKSDLYSLGLTLYEMITGRPLFNPRDGIISRLRDIKQSLNLEFEDYPPSILQLVEAMLANDSQDRPDLESCRHELMLA